MVKLEFGKTYFPPTQTLVVSDDLVRGSGWQAERVGEEFVFEFLAARHGGGVDRHNITADEFTRLKQGTLSADDLISKYDTA
jgi:hypothetical protein